jgi:hypothetical protein
MFTPAPIDLNFVPYTKRRVLKRNAGLFVDGAAGAGRSGGRVTPQSASCAGRSDCSGPCHVFPDGTALYCMGGECTATAAQCGR